MTLEHFRVIDTATFDAWCPIKELLDKRCLIINIKGTVVFEDNEQVTVALLIDDFKPPESVASYVAIPKVAIISRSPA